MIQGITRSHQGVRVVVGSGPAQSAPGRYAFCDVFNVLQLFGNCFSAGSLKAIPASYCNVCKQIGMTKLPVRCWQQVLQASSGHHPEAFTVKASAAQTWVFWSHRSIFALYPSVQHGCGSSQSLFFIFTVPMLPHLGWLYWNYKSSLCVLSFDCALIVCRVWLLVFGSVSSIV